MHHAPITPIINNSTKILSDVQSKVSTKLITDRVNNYKVSLNVQEHAKNEPFTKFTKF